MSKQSSSQGYNGNPNLPLPNDIIALSADELSEFIKCKEDPIYFIRNYVKIVHVDHGIVKFDLWPFQEDIINNFTDNRFVICKLARQSGKSTVVVAGYFLWYILFNTDVSVAVLANKEETAIQLLDRWKQSYELLPMFLKQGIIKWDQKVVKLANNSRVRAAATSASAIRGDTFNVLFLDEFAFVPENIALEFMTSVYPTITSGKTTKLFIVSTPNGYNLFYKIWNDAVEGRNTYKAVGYTWRDIPGRDEKWAEETRKNLGNEQKFQQEFECDFMGSANTLVAPWKLAQLSYIEALESRGELMIYQKPILARLDEDGETLEPHIYVCLVDVGQGQEKDYSVCQVVDISQTPWVQVAKWRSNKIKPPQFAATIRDLGNMYNKAYLFFEINAEGGAVADMVGLEFEYENIIYVFPHPKKGQQLSTGHHKRARLGLKQSEATKRVGCMGLKSLMENNRLLITDYETIREFTTFIAKMDKKRSTAKTYEAEVGNHDDCISPLVLLGWLTMQPGFEHYIGMSMREMLAEGHGDQAFDKPFIGLMGDLSATLVVDTVGSFEVVEDPEFWSNAGDADDDKGGNWLM